MLLWLLSSMLYQRFRLLIPFGCRGGLRAAYGVKQALHWSAPTLGLLFWKRSPSVTASFGASVGAASAARSAHTAHCLLFIGFYAFAFCSHVNAQELKIQPLKIEPLDMNQSELDKKPSGSDNQSKVLPKLLLKPGQPIATGMKAEDIVATYNVDLAKEQVAAYPDSPEASFVLAVALTRTSMVEEALKEVRRARRLADQQGGPAYFDHMIAAYEKMLESYPDDNHVRYGLAWAYYMKAYVLSQYSKKVQNTLLASGKTSLTIAGVTSGSNAPNTLPIPPLPLSAASAQNGKPSANLPWQNTWVNALTSSQKTSQNFPQIKGALENAAPDAVPQIKHYYEEALRNLDDLLKREPNDVWAKVYRAFLNAEYTGDLNSAMIVWQGCQAKAPENPAPYFFLGEGYLKQGNLKECLHNISKAIALRSLGK